MQSSNVKNVKGIPIGPCKLCGADVIDKGKFFGCSAYFDSGCGFTISKVVLGKELSPEDIKTLLNTGDTRLIEGFQKKTGKGTFKAVISWDEEREKLTWKFPNSNVNKLPTDLLKPLVIYEPPDSDTKREFEAIEREALALKHPCKVVDVRHGPRVTQYQLQPKKGVNITGYKRFNANFQAALFANKLNMYIPIPGTNRVGIEIPTKHPFPVQLRGLLEDEEYQAKKRPLSFPLGMDLYGKPIFADLASMPHLLVAGATGAGKSVFLNSLILSLLYGNEPHELKFLFIDPKQVELSIYEGIPHLRSTVVKDAKRAGEALSSLVKEMMNRYSLMEEAGVRNIDGYNAKLLKKDPKALKLPYIVAVVDEVADLIMADEEGHVEHYIVRLAQLARAAGIHMVIATQRPTKKVLSPIIKANMPVRIAFSVASSMDSMTILDQTGAENLLGKGDMLYQPKDGPRRRLQSGFVSDEETEKVVEYIRKKYPPK
ncbi:DNA translocase FtsK (plasmid) [Rossellomorea sp. AcN35-11]|nr:topoisomerase C-terminal repeat-containing protein [Rossellomorea aquimaris]WJV31790.1 DNA translocase FtsK [Rossellomorea sp. AcN35-11]